jgi:hypothetical protein
MKKKKDEDIKNEGVPVDEIPLDLDEEVDVFVLLFFHVNNMIF